MRPTASPTRRRLYRRLGMDPKPWIWRPQERDLADAVGSAIDIIHTTLRQARRPYIAYSGGKDSEMLRHLVHHVDPTVAVVWADDELEFPETVAHMERMMPSFKRRHVLLGSGPHGGWFQPWTDRHPWRNPLPGTMGPPGDARQRLRGLGYTTAFIGLRVGESWRRRQHIQAVIRDHGKPIYRAPYGLWHSLPMWDWSAQEIWRALREMEIPYNGAYDRMTELGVPIMDQRVGPLPLTPRWILEEGWPDLWQRLAARYGSERWR